jgi:hypothetical protein
VPRPEAHARLAELLALAATGWQPPSWLGAVAHGEHPPDVTLFTETAKESSGIVVVPGQAISVTGSTIEVAPARALVRTLSTSLTDPRRDAFLLATLGDQITKALQAALDALYDEHGYDRLAVPAAERQQRRVALEQRLAEIELLEEEAIVELEHAGVEIVRRPDVSGVALFHDRVLRLEASA